jgi:hypothetical protein
MPAFSTVERAFQLARAGGCQSLDDLRNLLKQEGYADAAAQTSFPMVRRQLNDLMRGRATMAPVRPERRKRATLRLNYGQP